MPRFVPIEFTQNGVDILNGVPTVIAHNENMIVREMIVRDAAGNEMLGFQFTPDPNDPTNRLTIDAVNDDYLNSFVWLFGSQQVQQSTITLNR